MNDGSTLIPLEILEDWVGKVTDDKNMDDFFSPTEKTIALQPKIAKILAILLKKDRSFTEIARLIGGAPKTIATKLNRLQENWFVYKEPWKRGHYSLTSLGKKILTWIQELPEGARITEKRISKKQKESQRLMRIKRPLLRQIRFHYENYTLDYRRHYLLQFFFIFLQHIERAESTQDLKTAFQTAKDHLTTITKPISSRCTEIFEIVEVFNELIHVIPP